MADLASLPDDALHAQAFHDLSVRRLCRLANPLRCWPEMDRPVTRAEVLRCVAEQRQALEDTPSWLALLRVPDAERPTPAQSRERHVRKIAFFVVHGVRDPIDLDVGVPSMGCVVDHLVDDGNHRLAGAWIRGDRTIPARISGSLDHAQDLGLWNPNPFEREAQRRMDLQLAAEAAAPRKAFGPG